VARRSPLARVPYALTQAARVRGGAGAIAGNHVILELADHGGYVVLAHLRAGSIRVGKGESVAAGRELAACGNSGNSAQPHLHIQVMDSTDPFTARGLPMSFRTIRCGVDPVGRRSWWSRASPTSRRSSNRCDAPDLVSRLTRGSLASRFPV